MFIEVHNVFLGSELSTRIIEVSNYLLIAEFFKGGGGGIDLPLTLVQNNNLHPALIVLFIVFFKRWSLKRKLKLTYLAHFIRFQRLEWKQDVLLCLYVRAYTRQSHAIVCIILIDKPSSGALLFERWYNNINNFIHFIFSRLITTYYFDNFMWFINIYMHGMYDSSWSKSPHTAPLSLKF